MRFVKGSSDGESAMVFEIGLGVIGRNFVIRDTRRNKSMAGTRRNDEFLKVLGCEDGRRVKQDGVDGVDGYQRFKFGGSTICQVKIRVTALVGSVGERYMLAWCGVEASISILQGNGFIKKDVV